MYALRVTDIPLRRSSKQEHKDGAGAASTGPSGVDINFEESKLDLSLRQVCAKPSLPQRPCAELMPKTSKDNTLAKLKSKSSSPIETSTQLPPTIRQRRRLLKSPRKNPEFGKQTCNETSAGLRDPERHHIHYTEDYPDPLSRQVGSGVSLQQEQSAEAERPKVKGEENGKETGVLPATLAHDVAPEVPESEPAKRLEDPKHGTVLDHQDNARDIKSKSKFKRGLARVKSISGSLWPSGWTSKDSQRDTTEQSSASKADPFASNDPNAPATGFLTDEAIEHDRLRFANAFRSRAAVRQQQQQLKSETSCSTASSTALRGGGRGGGPSRGSGSGNGNGNSWGFGGMSGWPFNMDDRMRRFQEAPEFAPFRNSYENHSDDGTYERIQTFDYNSLRDGSIGGLGRGGGRRGLQGGRQGGLCGLFGRRPRPGPGEAADGDPMGMGFPGEGQAGMGFPGMGMDMGFPEMMGLMGPRGRGMGRPPRGGGRGRGGRGDFGMGDEEMGGRGGFGMGHPGMGGMGGRMMVGFPIGFMAIPISMEELSDGGRGVPLGGGGGGGGGESEYADHGSDSGDDGGRGDGDGGGRGSPPPGDLNPIDAKNGQRRWGGRGAR